MRYIVTAINRKEEKIYYTGNTKRFWSSNRSDALLYAHRGAAQRKVNTLVYSRPMVEPAPEPIFEPATTSIES
jgi:hypothetical protein